MPSYLPRIISQVDQDEIDFLAFQAVAEIQIPFGFKKVVPVVEAPPLPHAQYVPATLL
ncbi:MAG: hypothetical protein WCK72_00760 [Actinomycetes bacterium]